jgi:hypothetical protein
MADRNSLTQQRLREVLHYDPLTGVFTWRVNRRARFGRVGEVAGTISKSDKHIYISIDCCRYSAQRLAWFYMTGDWPIFEVDHEDTDPVNNRWRNLRDVPHQTNMQNIRRPRSNNSTGFLGVSRKRHRFSPRIKVDGKNLYLGTFDTAEEAHAVFLAAKRIHHPGNTL